MIYVRLKYSKSPRTIATRFGVLEVLRQLSLLLHQNNVDGNYIKLPGRINGFLCEDDICVEYHIVVKAANSLSSRNDIVEISMATGIERYYLYQIQDLFGIHSDQQLNVPDVDAEPSKEPE